MPTHGDNIAEFFVGFRDPFPQTAYKRINRLFTDTFAARFWPDRFDNLFAA